MVAMSVPLNSIPTG